MLNLGLRLRLQKHARKHEAELLDINDKATKIIDRLNAIRQFCNSIYFLIVLMVILTCVAGYVLGLLLFWQTKI